MLYASINAYNFTSDVVQGSIPLEEVTKRPTTAGSHFKNSMIALVDQLARKVNMY